jgi:hypothetical protein
MSALSLGGSAIAASVGFDIYVSPTTPATNAVLSFDS